MDLDAEVQKVLVFIRSAGHQGIAIVDLFGKASQHNSLAVLDNGSKDIIWRALTERNDLVWADGDFEKDSLRDLRGSTASLKFILGRKTWKVRHGDLGGNATEETLTHEPQDGRVEEAETAAAHVHENAQLDGSEPNEKSPIAQVVEPVIAIQKEATAVVKPKRKYTRKGVTANNTPIKQASLPQLTASGKRRGRPPKKRDPVPDEAPPNEADEASRSSHIMDPMQNGLGNSNDTPFLAGIPAPVGGAGLRTSETPVKGGARRTRSALKKDVLDVVKPAKVMSTAEFQREEDEQCLKAGVPRVYMNPKGSERPERLDPATKRPVPSTIAVFKSDNLKDPEWLPSQIGSYGKVFPHLINVGRHPQKGAALTAQVGLTDSVVLGNTGVAAAQAPSLPHAHPVPNELAGNTQPSPIQNGLPQLPPGYFAQPYGMRPPIPPPGMMVQLHGNLPPGAQAQVGFRPSVPSYSPPQISSLASFGLQPPSTYQSPYKSPYQPLPAAQGPSNQPNSSATAIPTAFPGSRAPLASKVGGALLGQIPQSAAACGVNGQDRKRKSLVDHVENLESNKKARKQGSPAVAVQTLPLSAPHPNAAVVRERHASRRAAKEKVENELHVALAESRSAHVGDCVARLASVYNDRMGNLLVLDNDDAVVVFLEFANGVSSTPPIFSLLKSQVDAATVTVAGSFPMELLLTAVDADGVKTVHRFNFGSKDASQSEDANAMKLILNQMPRSVQIGAKSHEENIYVEPAVDPEPEPEPERLTCNTCTGTWLNPEGLKYHLTKSNTTCNPNFNPAIPPKKRGVVKKTPKPRRAAAARKPRRVSKGIDESDSEDNEDGSVDVDSGDSSMMDDDRFFAAAAFSGYDSRNRKRGRSTSQVHTSGDLNILQDLLSEAVDSLESNEPEDVLSEVVPHEESEKLILDLLAQNEGSFPGDQGLWYAFVVGWNKKLCNSGILPTPDLCNSALLRLVKAGKANVVEFSFSAKDSQSETTRTIVIDPSCDSSSPAVDELKRMIENDYPEFYVPSGFGPDEDTIRRLRSFLDSIEKQAPGKDEPLSKRRRTKRSAGTSNREESMAQEDDTDGALLGAAESSKRKYVRKVPTEQELAIKKAEPYHPWFNETPASMQNPQTGAWAPKLLENPWYKKTGKAGLNYVYAVSGAAPLTYLQAEDGSWSVKPGGHGVKPAYKRPPKRKAVTLGDTASTAEKKPRIAKNSTVVTLNKNPISAPTILQAEDGTWSATPLRERKSGWPKGKKRLKQVTSTHAEDAGGQTSFHVSFNEESSRVNTPDLASAMQSEMSTPGESFDSTRLLRRPSRTKTLIDPSMLAFLDEDPNDSDFEVGAAKTNTIPVTKEIEPVSKRSRAPRGSLKDTSVQALMLDDDDEPIPKGVSRRKITQQPLTRKRVTKGKERFCHMMENRMIGTVDAGTFTLFDNKHSLQIIPTDAISHARNKDNVLRPEDTNRVIAGIIAISTITGGATSIIDWLLIAAVFKNFNLSQTWLMKLWQKLMASERAGRIQQLTTDFQQAFLVAYEKGEVATIDFNSLVTYDWNKLIDWTLETLDFNRKPYMLTLPDTRDELANTYDLTPVDAENISNWRETVYFKGGKGRMSTLQRLEHVSSVANTIDPGSPPIARSADDYPISNFAMAKSWARATSLSLSINHDTKPALAKLKQLDDSVLATAVEALKSDDFLKAPTRGFKTPTRKYDLMIGYDAPLRQKSFNQRQFVDALAFKRKLDKTFASGKACVRVPSPASQIGLYNMLAAGRIRLEPVGEPDSEFGLCAIDHKQRAYMRLKQHEVGFNVDIYPTATYIYDRENFVDTPDAVIETSSPPRGSAKGELPIWYGIDGNLMPEMWLRALVAVAGVVSTRPGSTPTTLKLAFKPLLEEWEIARLLEWGEANGVFEAVGKVGTEMEGMEGWTTAEWWWAGVGAECRKFGTGEVEIGGDDED